MKNTKDLNLEGLIQASGLPPRLIKAVVQQMGGWESFKESAPVAAHGIDGGVTGFVYYHHTEPFAKRNRRDISKMASEQADDQGIGVFEMIRGFGCFRGDKLSDEEIGYALYAGENTKDGANVLNALAWYAGEEVSRAYCDLIGGEE